jgi:Pyruvate/2-oxoacid:ferredoxin oxidoreductase delta subunit
MTDQFARIFQAPSFAEPYLSDMVSRDEMLLVTAFPDQPFTAAMAAAALHLSGRDAETLLDKAYRRAVIQRDGDAAGRFRASDFYHRLDCFATFDSPERWQAMPESFRRQANDWSLHTYAAIVAGQVQPGPTDQILLLAEMDRVIDAADEICLAPCNCRSTNLACGRARDVCLRMNEGAREARERGWAKPITKEEARAVVLLADQEGLMHTASFDAKTGAPTGACNCCADDCYPFRASEILGTRGTWPRAFYVAEHDASLCNNCGRCAKRCHFGAFTSAVSAGAAGAAKKSARFDAALCRGCGLCATTCARGAIRMAPLNAESHR